MESPQFSSYLWGIETSLIASSTLPFAVFILPMRNWNYLCGRVRRNWNRVFILPMRNWNAILSFLASRDSNHVFILPMRNWNSHSLGNCPACSIRFHLTYEELKLFLGERGFPLLTVFILPMRNWNRPFLDVLIVPGMFSSYLWGIETKDESKYLLKLKEFSSYLWGIETCNTQ